MKTRIAIALASLLITACNRSTTPIPGKPTPTLIPTATSIPPDPITWINHSISNRSVSLEWNEVDRKTHYEVWRGIILNGTTVWPNTPLAHTYSNSHTDDTLLPNLSYAYAVRAMFHTTEGRWSHVIYVNTQK